LLSGPRFRISLWASCKKKTRHKSDNSIERCDSLNASAMWRRESSHWKRSQLINPFWVQCCSDYTSPDCLLGSNPCLKGIKREFFTFECFLIGEEGEVGEFSLFWEREAEKLFVREENS
jgi:hypothetical protein